MATPLPPTDHKISLDDASKLTARFRTDGYRGPVPVMAFNTAGYERILKQPECTGIRCYPGLHDDGTIAIVMVGVDAQGNDMVDGELSQEGFPCPEFCPDENVLNGGK